MTETLQCLKKHGQRLDLEIAKGDARASLAISEAAPHGPGRTAREAIVCKTIGSRTGGRSKHGRAAFPSFVPAGDARSQAEAKKA